MVAVVSETAGVCGGHWTGGAVLLDDVHDAPRHAGDAAGARPPRPRHRPTDRRGHNEEVRTGGTLRVGRAELLGTHQAEDLGAVRRTVLIIRRHTCTAPLRHHSSVHLVGHTGETSVNRTHLPLPRWISRRAKLGSTHSPTTSAPFWPHRLHRKRC